MPRLLSRRHFICDSVALAAVLLAARRQVANAQQPAVLRKIGILSPDSGWPEKWQSAFVTAMKNFGYEEGRNFVFHWKAANGDFDRLPYLAAELVEEKVDVIVTGITPTVRAAKHATSSIPIVFYFVGDPVQSGVVASLSHPGGNVTGLSSMSPKLHAKRLEILKDALPGLSRVALMWNPNSLYRAQDSNELKSAAGPPLSLELTHVSARTPAEFERAVDLAINAHAEALYLVDDPLFFTNRRAIIDLALKAKLPALQAVREFAEDGGLLSYSADIADSLAKSVAYVDKILKGANPGDLPIGQPTKFQLVVNVKTAKAIDVRIPESFLARADEVIE